VAHGGVAGAIVESLIVLAVVSVLLAVWLRERRAEIEAADRLSDEE
jgi:competence protein ComGC